MAQNPDGSYSFGIPTQNPNQVASSLNNFYGTQNEARGYSQGLSQSKDLYGMGVPEIGSGIQQNVKRLESRVDMTDPVSEAIRASKSSRVAQANKANAGRGIAGGVAGNAANQAARTGDMDVAAAMEKITSDRISSYGGALEGLADRTMANAVTQQNIGATRDMQAAQGYGGLASNVTNRFNEVVSGDNPYRTGAAVMTMGGSELFDAALGGRLFG